MPMPKGFNQEETLKKVAIVDKRLAQGVPLYLACQGANISTSWYRKIKKAKEK